MVTYILLYALNLSTFGLDFPKNNIEGLWSLESVILYEGEEFQTVTNQGESTIYYEFVVDDLSSRSGILKIDDEGETQIQPYEFNNTFTAIILDKNRLFNIDSIDEKQLVISHQYNQYKSQYRLKKVE